MPRHPRVQESRCDIEVKTCKFLSCPLARAYPPACVLCTALVAGWLGGLVAVQHPLTPPGTILGLWVFPKSGWVGLAPPPPPCR